MSRVREVVVGCFPKALRSARLVHRFSLHEKRLFVKVLQTATRSGYLSRFCKQRRVSVRDWSRASRVRTYLWSVQPVEAGVCTKRRAWLGRCVQGARCRSGVQRVHKRGGHLRKGLGGNFVDRQEEQSIHRRSSRYTGRAPHALQKSRKKMC
eukprot:scaffold11_cov257-Pinguiococcus_pyrenoidosus.AAC.61